MLHNKINCPLTLNLICGYVFDNIIGQLTQFWVNIVKFHDKEKQKENKMADTQAVKTGRKKDGGHKHWTQTGFEV